MGKIEQGARIKRRRSQIQKLVLQTIAVTGMLAVAAVAPNALQVLAFLDGGKNRKKRPRYVIDTAFSRLLEKGCIHIEKTARGNFARLSPLGKQMLAGMVARSPDSRKHKRWDKRWRMVIYDIKDVRQDARRKLQQTLKNFGFAKLQNSVWVYPHDTEELVALLKADFKIGREVLYVVVEHIEYDAALKKHFALK